MHKVLIVCLAICLLNVHAQVKRDGAEGQSSGGFIENVQKQFHDFGDKVKDTFNPERITDALKSGYDQAIDKLKIHPEKKAT